jgi:rhamnogalacturonyl hydrolase YesR
MTTLPKKTVYCHRTGFQHTCFDMVTQKECQLWVQVLGENPQTGEVMNSSGCADAFMPMLTIQTGRLIGQTTASVDKVATEVRKHADESVTLGSMMVQRAGQAVSDAILTLEQPPGFTHGLTRAATLLPGPNKTP